MGIVLLTLDERMHPIHFHDTAGHEEFEQVRQVFYKTADAVVLCYDFTDRNSFVNVEYKWWGELQKPICRRRVPIILVATKSDLRNSGLEVATEESMALCNRINARAFLECSASTQANIEEVIYESVRAAVRFSSGTEREPSDKESEEAEDSEGDSGNNAVGFCMGRQSRKRLGWKSVLSS